MALKIHFSCSRRDQFCISNDAHWKHVLNEHTISFILLFKTTCCVYIIFSKCQSDCLTTHNLLIIPSF